MEADDADSETLHRRFHRREIPRRDGRLDGPRALGERLQPLHSGGQGL